MDGSARTAVDPEAEALELLRQAIELLLDARRRRAPVAEKLVTAEQLAELFSVPVSAIESKARDGSLPCVRLGRWVRFEPSAVLDALRAEGRRT
jgi:excisionase family DNA binding protein